MLRVEWFSVRSGDPEGRLRGVLHICGAEQSISSFHNVFPLSSRLFDAPQCRHVLDSDVEIGSTVLIGATGLFLSMQFWAVLFVSSFAVIGIA